MSSKLQLDVRHLNWWWRHYEVRQAWCLLQVKLYDLCLSALKWFVYHARRYTSARLYFTLHREYVRSGNLIEIYNQMKCKKCGSFKQSNKDGDRLLALVLFCVSLKNVLFHTAYETLSATLWQFRLQGMLSKHICTYTLNYYMRNTAVTGQQTRITVHKCSRALMEHWLIE